MHCLFSCSHFNNSKYQNFQYLSTFKMSTAPIWIFPLWVFIKSRRTSKCALFLLHVLKLLMKKRPKASKCSLVLLHFQMFTALNYLLKVWKKEEGNFKICTPSPWSACHTFQEGIKNVHRLQFLICTIPQTSDTWIGLKLKMLGKICWDSDYRRGRVAML